MAITCTIGSSTFNAMSTTYQRTLIELNVYASEYKIARQHVPGVDGNYLIRQGKFRKNIVAKLRYLEASVSAALTKYYADCDAWDNELVSITDEGGNTFTNCQLNSMQRVAIKSDGRGGVYIDVVASFTQET